ncbi:MAG: hypothetical protein U0792_07965 [Gemmataceae bacterium]
MAKHLKGKDAELSRVLSAGDIKELLALAVMPAGSVADDAGDLTSIIDLRRPDDVQIVAGLLERCDLPK